MSDLPENWIETEIGGLCSLKNGRAFKPSEWQTSGLPIVRIQNLNNPASAFNHFQGELDERNRLRGGELLFAWSGTPGTSFGAHVWRGGDAVLNQHIFRVDFDEALLDKRFFRSAINQKLSELIDVAHGGVGLRHVTKGVFEKTLVALPPRPEQSRIANQLDTLLTRVQACNDRFDAIPALLKRFRQTVLGAATNGGLTAEWRTDPLAKEWIACTVGQVLNGKPRNGYSPQAVDYETSIRSLTLSATTTGKFFGRHSKFIAEPIAVDSHLWLEPGDILIQRANSLEYVGVSAIFDGLEKQFIYPDLMMKCRPNERVKNKYLFYALSAESTRSYFRENATGTAGNMPKINQQTVMSAPLLLPPLDEQAEIVRRVEALFALADSIGARCTAARTQAQRLSLLVLAKAFRGELVPQDPTDEPASALLARIASSNTVVAGKNKQKVPLAQKKRAQAAINL